MYLICVNNIIQILLLSITYVSFCILSIIIIIIILVLFQLQNFVHLKENYKIRLKYHLHLKRSIITMVF